MSLQNEKIFTRRNSPNDTSYWCNTDKKIKELFALLSKHRFEL